MKRGDSPPRKCREREFAHEPGHIRILRVPYTVRVEHPPEFGHRPRSAVLTDLGADRYEAAGEHDCPVLTPSGRTADLNGPPALQISAPLEIARVAVCSDCYDRPSRKPESPVLRCRSDYSAMAVRPGRRHPETFGKPRSSRNTRSH